MTIPRFLPHILKLAAIVAGIVTLICYAAQPGHAQPRFDNWRDSLFYKYAIPKGTDNIITNSYYIIRLSGPNEQMPKGTRVVRNISDGLTIVETAGVNADLKLASGIAAAANDDWKLSAALEEKKALLQHSGQRAMLFSITAKNLDTLFSSLQKKKVLFKINAFFKSSQSAVISCSPAVFFNAVLTGYELVFADEYISPKTDMIINSFDRTVNGLNMANFYYPAADGHGITIGIKEKMMDETDIDLRKRILPSPIADAIKDNHANTIATLAGGAGNSFYTGKGVAWRCIFFPSSFSNLFPDSSLLLQQNNVSVQNHSYGTIMQPYYGAEAMSYDLQTAQNNSFVAVFSSGNLGPSASNTGMYANIAGLSNITGNFKEAKNVITVAAVDTGGRIAAFSSSGPLYDGRLAPQVAALGPNGTSEAAAIVSGAAAVLQQVYKDSNNQLLPAASLVKAILFTTARDIENKGIDYQSGFGLLDLYKALSCMQKKEFDAGELSSQGVWAKYINVPAGSANLKVTLCWTDTAASVNNYKALVNDLDLELVHIPTGMVYKPWVLSNYANADSLWRLPQRGRDSLNTAEQVSIDLPAAGQYLVRVSANKIQTMQKQPFHIAYNWDTLNRLHFTSPVHAADISRNENIPVSITWDVSASDPNASGDLFVTFNNGANWQLLGSAIRLSQKRFYWLPPAGANSAKFRMDCFSGSFYSPSFVIGPLSKLSVDYLCTDSLRVSWPKSSMANTYQVYSLADTAFMKPIALTPDTFISFGRDRHPENIYAIQPVVNNGPEAQRSIAPDISNQGTGCFYKALLAETAGDSVLLSLSMAFTGSVDSLELLRVTSTGGQLVKLATMFTSPGETNYHCFDSKPTAGTNFYKAVIWTRGRPVQTDIVYLIYSAKKKLFIYPNPVPQGQSLHYSLNDATGEAQLQFTDITGRVAKQYHIQFSGTISTSGWLPGLYSYRLLDASGKSIDIGKLVVQ